MRPTFALLVLAFIRLWMVSRSSHDGPLHIRTRGGNLSSVYWVGLIHSELGLGLTVNLLARKNWAKFSPTQCPISVKPHPTRLLELPSLIITFQIIHFFLLEAYENDVVLTFPYPPGKMGFCCCRFDISLSTWKNGVLL